MLTKGVWVASGNLHGTGAVVAAAPVVAPTMKRAKRQQIALENKGKILCCTKKNILTNAPRRLSWCWGVWR